MRPMEIGIKTLQSQLHQEFHSSHRGVEFGQISSVNADKTYDVQVGSRAYPMTGLRPTKPGNLRIGDQVHVGHLHGNPDLPFIFAAGGGTGKATAAKDANPPPPPFILGVWPQAKANSRRDCISEQEQTPPDLSAGSVGYFSLSVASGDYPPLGLVVLDGIQTVVYWPKLVSGQLQLVLTKISGWEVPLGAPFALPTGLDSVFGLRTGWLAYDQQYDLFWCVGWGDSSRRNTLYCVSGEGQILGTATTGANLVQCGFGAGVAVRGWHSRRSPTTRLFSDDATIKAYKMRRNQLVQAWTLDPQALLTGYQIATSADRNSQFSSNYTLDGGWPIDSERRRMALWVSGSKKMPNNNDSTMITLHPDNVGTGSVVGGFAQEDDSRTTDQAAVLCGVDIDTGAVTWRRDLSFSPIHVFDSDNITTVEILHSANAISGSYGSLAIRSYFPHGSESEVGAVEHKTYTGFAAQDSMVISPGEITVPTCTVLDPFGSPHPEYSSYQVPVLPQININWGGGGVYNSPSTSGTYVGPKYDWFAPGHPVLCPLPFVDMGNSIEFGWVNDSDNEPHYKRLDNVGGVMEIDFTGTTWAAYAHQGQAIVGGKGDAQVQLADFTADFVPPVDPETQCGQWTKNIYYDVKMIGSVQHNQVLRLLKTGPNGEAYDSGGPGTDISQYFSRPASSIQWAARANVYQIVAFPNNNRVVLVRDWFDSAVDSGGLENHPYPVLSILDYGDLTTVDTIPLLDDFTTYLDETDPEDPVTRRVWDHYHNQECLTLGKGATGENSWCLWRHLVRRRTDDTLHCNEVLLTWDSGNAPVVTRRLTVLGEFVRPESAGALGTLAIAGDKQIFSPQATVGSDWPIVVRDNA